MCRRCCAAFVACGWFGIQTWIGGAAIYKILKIFFVGLEHAPPVPGLDKNVAELGCFLFFWAINIFVIFRGIDSIRLLLNIKAPLLIILGLALLAWAYVSAGGFGTMLSQPSKFAEGAEKAGQFWPFFAAALTANVAFWATLSLNIPDFSRYAHFATRPSIRPSYRTAHDHDALFVHRRGRHIRSHGYLSR